MMVVHKESRTSLRVRVNMLTAALAAIAVFVSVVAIYLVTEHSLRTQVNDRLSRKVDVFVASSASGAPLSFFGVGGGQTLKVALITRSGDVIAVDHSNSPFAEEDALRDGPEMDVAQGRAPVSVRELGGYQVLAKRAPTGETIVVAESLQPTRTMLNKLLLALTSLGALVIVLSVLAGSVAIRTGLRPVRRLMLSTESIAQTQDLQPIPVRGEDELAQFARRFNVMLESLRRSRDHQRALIVDAGRELLTPLTALRTNLEFLIMVSNGLGPSLSDAERNALSTDVVEQIEEISRRVGALVDRARESDAAAAT
ncbi:HAMP domain-containing protein [Rhodococcus opacus]|uniref:HAMP domain-containing protein n=1 Tax=Rhodococcus opacus TaxID=37919 RepID=UPI001C47CBE7|nr:HAMP domain-containing protein [Rhodococcus opacus]MBV6760623.1 HAMP domain-containing protein [Rhodococcus opacus]